MRIAHLAPTLGFALLTLTGQGAARQTIYKVTVTTDGPQLFLVNDTPYLIQAAPDCVEFVFRERVTVVWRGAHTEGNRIIFNRGFGTPTVCAIKRLLTETEPRE